MVLTAYFDESGTHAGSPVTGMAGFLADARQWRKYEKRTTKLFTRYGVREFHAIDVRRGHKDFKGWTVDRKLEFLDDFGQVINEALQAGAVSLIREEDFAYYQTLPWPRKVRRDSKYALLFRGCIAHMIDVVAQIPMATEPTLHIVLEDGHNNSEDALRAYNWALERTGHKKALAGLTFATKKNCLPLAAADFVAYSAWGQEVGQKPIGELKRPSKTEASYRHNLAKVLLNRDSLESLAEQAANLADPNSILSQVFSWRPPA